VIGFAGLLTALWTSAGALVGWRISWRTLTTMAWESDFNPGTPIVNWTAIAVLRWILPPALVVWGLALASNVAQGGLVFSSEALTPNLARLGPGKKLEQMFSLAGLAPAAKSLAPVAALIYIGVSVLSRDWELLLHSAQLSDAAIGQLAYDRVFEICWKSSLVLLFWSGIDYLLQRHKLESDLRMSKQELREEYKETDGNPNVKARLRRLQRQLRRRRMLKEVEHATVVITNPTHFAVALEYRPQMAAPVVVAKGVNALAEQIKRVARWHAIPVAENPPLAQALYRTVEVGQAIPAKLYAAVAEILAFLYRAQLRAQREWREY
jgi:flagellar biosynthetic protein FlhB